MLEFLMMFVALCVVGWMERRNEPAVRIQTVRLEKRRTR